MEKNMIVAFANQKGGVGKTTLCALFANYLVLKNHKVIVVDCDNQRSFVAKRERDRKKYPETEVPYEVQAIEVKDQDVVTKAMETLRSQEAIILLDTPGHLAQNGLVPLFALTDFIIIPYQFESTSIQSTGRFITFIHRLRKAISTMTGEMIFVVNNWDARFGRKADLELYAKTERSLTELGKVAPRIGHRADIERANTMFLMDQQGQLISDCFDYIYNVITGTQEEITPTDGEKENQEEPQNIE